MKEQALFSIDDTVIIRTPSFAAGILAMPFDEVIQLPMFQEAIYLASPTLYNTLIQYIAHEKLTEKERAKCAQSLYKYWARMCTRCTPFGLFAQCATVQFATNNDDNSIVADKANDKRVTRLDMHFLCALAQYLAKHEAIQPQLLFYPNTSVYEIGEAIRYIEYRYKNNQRIHEITETPSNPELQHIIALAKNGIHIQSIENYLLTEGYDADTINSYIQQIINSQLLVSELEPAITGNSFLWQIITCLQTIHTQAPNNAMATIIGLLQTIQTQLQQLDATGVNSIAAYKAIVANVALLEVPFDESKLFQVDVTTYYSDGFINHAVKKTIYDGFAILNKLFAHRKHTMLQQFATAFTERYDTDFVPIQKALDVAFGIGFGNNNHIHNNSLLQDMYVPHTQQETTITVLPIDSWLHEKLQHCQANKQYTYTITDAAIKTFAPDYEAMSPSFSAMFKVVDAQEASVILEGISGASAASLLGRFAHTNEHIQDTILRITTQEEAINNDVLFAEVIHLPESRTGNVLLHPACRPYEIPYLAKSSLPAAQVIALEDIQVGVRHGKIILYSAIHKKQIVPRLSNAHNYNYKSLPLYHFLCSLQYQDAVPALSFHWGAFGGNYFFLPRVVYKKCILHEACWQFGKKEINEFTSANGIVDAGLLQLFMKAHDMPNMFLLVDGDNELFCNTNDTLSLNAFIKTIKGRSHFVLKEYIANSNAFVTNKQGDTYNHQCIASFIKNTASYSAPTKTIAKGMQLDVKQQFAMGTEWLYYKIYCNEGNALDILIQQVMPLVNSLIEDGIVAKWFFIKYNDPNYHIRLRMELYNRYDIGAVISTCMFYVEPLLENGLIHTLQTDVYKRELERYGYGYITQAEALFWLDSESTLAFEDLIKDAPNEAIRWLWGMKDIDMMLQYFGYTLTEKMTLLQTIATAFAKEHHADTAVKATLSKKFTAYKNDIHKWLHNRFAENDLLELEAIAIIEKKWQKAIPIIAILQEAHHKQIINVTEIIPSYIHMMLNRLFINKHRLQEFVLYDLLYRYYYSVHVQERQWDGLIMC